jgi:hypothetical protein
MEVPGMLSANREPVGRQGPGVAKAIARQGFVEVHREEGPELCRRHWIIIPQCGVNSVAAGTISGTPV